MTSDSSRDRTDDSRSSSEGDEPSSGRGCRRRSVLQTVGVGVVGATLGASGLALGRQRNAVAAGSPVQASQLRKLTASDAEGNDQFGYAVSVSADETTALVGALYEDHAGASSGAAYVYDLSQDPPTETKLTASDAEEGKEFGEAVSVSADGTTALVGAIGDNEEGCGSGAAYVYDLSQDPPTETKLAASNADGGDLFGSAVSVSADGTTALVGASFDDPINSGSAYVYDLSQDPPTETKLTASDADRDQFGEAVSVSADGTTALVGSILNDDGGGNSGAAYVYDLSQDPPTETKLTASDADGGDLFGIAVSMNGDGTTALVGADGNDDGGDDSGAAYVYDLSQDPPTETKLTASDADSGDIFGRAVSVSADGTTALIGAAGDNDGGENSGSGSAYVYDITQGSPTETKFTASDAEGGDIFGRAVSVNGDGSTALVGAPHDDDDGDYSGSAYVFELTDA